MNQPKYGFSISDIPMVYRPTVVNKPYGYIRTFVSTDLYCMKEIRMTKGYRSSLEYHINKTESYHILKGKLKLGFRIGGSQDGKRTKNVSVILNQGESFDLPRGMMHIRIALEDTVILEVSTKDSDRDSQIVEDGATYEHNED